MTVMSFLDYFIQFPIHLIRFAELPLLPLSLAIHWGESSPTPPVPADPRSGARCAHRCT